MTFQVFIAYHDESGFWQTYRSKARALAKFEEARREDAKAALVKEYGPRGAFVSDVGSFGDVEVFKF